MGKFDFRSLSEADTYEMPLLDEGIKIEEKIGEDIKQVLSIESGFCGNRKLLKQAFSTYLQETEKVQEYRSKIREYQQYASSCEGVANSDKIPVFSDVVEQIDKKLVVCSDLINRKENEISSSRITFTNIGLSIAAIAVALIAIA